MASCCNQGNEPFFSWNVGNLLTSCENSDFSRRTLFHEVCLIQRGGEK